MTIIAQMTLAFSVAGSGNIPYPTQIETAAQAALEEAGYVMSDPRPGIRGMATDSLNLHVARKDGGDGRIPATDLKDILNVLARKTNCEPILVSIETSPAASQVLNGAYSVQLKPFIRVEMKCL